MERKGMKTLTGVIVFLMLISLVSATGVLKSQNGSIVLQPVDNQVLPQGDNTVDLGGPNNRWNEIYTDFVYAKTSAGAASGFYLRNSTGNNVFHWVYNEPTKTMYLSQTGVSELMTFKEGDGNLNFFKSLNPAADKTYNLGDSSHTWGSIYAYALRNVSTIYSGNNKLVFVTGRTGGLNDFVFDGSGGNDKLYYSIISPAGKGINLRLITDANWSRMIGFDMDTIGGARGLIFSAAAGDKQIIPQADNQYDLGSSAYAWKTVYAYSYVDKTPFKSSDDLKSKYGKTALQLIREIKADRSGNLNHTTLPEFVRVDAPSSSTQAGVKIVTAGSLKKEYGRDIGASVSLNTVGIQELADKVDALEKRVTELEKKVNATKKG